MKVVYETADYPEVLIKKGILEDSGIPVYVDNLHSAGGAMPQLGFTVGYKVLVPDAAEAEALTIVNDVEPHPKPTDTEAINGETRSFFHSPGKILAVALLAYFVFAIVDNAYASAQVVCIGDQRYTFSSCGYTTIGRHLGIARSADHVSNPGVWLPSILEDFND